MEGTPPGVPRYVILGVPHTSFLDFFLMVAYTSLHDMPLRWLGKKSLFTGPFGGILRRLGGVPVNRTASHHMVDQTIALLRKNERCVVCIAPEGTRRRAAYWKTGFYYIALGAGVPIVLSYVDAGRRRVGIGPLLYPSGDIEADMQIVADFYNQSPASILHVRAPCA